MSSYCLTEMRIFINFAEKIENLLSPNYKSVGMFYWMTNLMWAPSCCHICVLQMKYFHIYDHQKPPETTRYCHAGHLYPDTRRQQTQSYRVFPENYLKTFIKNWQNFTVGMWSCGYLLICFRLRPMVIGILPSNTKEPIWLHLGLHWVNELCCSILLKQYINNTHFE